MNPRIVLAALSLSAVGFISIVGSEGHTDRALVPTKYDRPTLGYGSTFHEDCRPVKLGETTSLTRALFKAAAHIGKEEKIFRASLPGVTLHQAECDMGVPVRYWCLAGLLDAPRADSR